MAVTKIVQLLIVVAVIGEISTKPTVSEQELVTQPEPQADTLPELEPTTQSETEAATPDLVTQSETDHVMPTESETETQPEPKTAEQPEPEIVTQPEQETVTQPEPKTTTQPEPEIVITQPTTIPPTSSEQYDEFLTNEIQDNKFELRAEYAKRMLSYMNQSVSPCDDFYEYACGNWKNAVEDRFSHHRRDNFLDIDFQISDAIHVLLQKSAQELELNNTEQWQITQGFYKSCLNAELLQFAKSQVYLDEIKNLIGGFPAVHKDWNADTFDWLNASAQLSAYGIKALVNEKIIPQYPFPPYFKLPEFGFDYNVHLDSITNKSSRGYILNRNRMQQYLQLYEVSNATASEIIDNIFEFWRAVHEVIATFEDNFDKCHPLSTEPFLEWRRYFEIAWMNKDFNRTEDLAEEVFVVTSCPCYYFYVKLNEIINKNKATVANYLAMKFLYQLDARLEKPKYQKEYCLQRMRQSFGNILDKVYYKEHFNAEKHDEVLSLLLHIRQSLRNLLKESDWLDESTRAEALLKEESMTAKIGRYEAPEIVERIIDEVGNLSVHNSYEENNLQMLKFETYVRRYLGLHNEQISNTTKPIELFLSSQANAFYYNMDNTIVVVAGILHQPAYESFWPYSLKYGTIGYLVGHEFTHGFDTMGANFDSFGEERYWWSNKSKKVFDERADCYAQHYNKYLVPEINRHIDGNTTKDENIADAGGLREAINSYRRFMKQSLDEHGNVPDEKMPGMDLSPEQLFFLGFAQLWCASYKEEHLWESLKDEHPIDKYRVLGALANNDDFAKAYECPLGSNLNKNETKCKLW